MSALEGVRMTSAAAVRPHHRFVAAWRPFYTAPHTSRNCSCYRCRRVYILRRIESSSFNHSLLGAVSESDSLSGVFTCGRTHILLTALLRVPLIVSKYISNSIYFVCIRLVLDTDEWCVPVAIEVVANFPPWRLEILDFVFVSFPLGSLL